MKAEPVRDAAPCEEEHGETSWPHEVNGDPLSRYPLSSCEGSSARAGVCAPKEAVSLWNLLGRAGSCQDLCPG